jgi:hypothetical protein
MKTGELGQEVVLACAVVEIKKKAAATGIPCWPKVTVKVSFRE